MRIKSPVCSRRAARVGVDASHVRRAVMLMDRLCRYRGHPFPAKYSPELM